MTPQEWFVIASIIQAVANGWHLPDAILAEAQAIMGDPVEPGVVL